MHLHVLPKHVNLLLHQDFRNYWMISNRTEMWCDVDENAQKESASSISFTFSQEYESLSSASSSLNDLRPQVLTANCRASSASLTFSLDNKHGNKFSFIWMRVSSYHCYDNS